MPELLLELGTEELPANSVRRAYEELAAKIAALLVAQNLLKPEVQPTSMGTPRRLIVQVTEVVERQGDSEKEFRGPGLKAAYDESGNPSQALLGFCRGQGVNTGDVRSDGQYVWVTKRIAGKSCSEILSENLPSIIRSLTFDKTMRWGASKMRFARPIRWILCVFDSVPVPFELEGVLSSNESRGHRFYSPEAFPASSFGGLLSDLRRRHVEPDPEIRKQMILDHLPLTSEEFPELPDALVAENVYLTEWPTPIKGEFSEDFLGLPDSVLSTVMAKHEKMFPIRTRDHQITNKFIFVRNSGENDSVRKGCEWVLNARMNDAKFFFDEDAKLTMENFLGKTTGIVFQEKLGSVFARSERLSELAKSVAPTDSAPELEWAAQAGRLAKADLSTGLVGELASLQGVVGGDYAKRDRLPDKVCWAISTQYDPSQNPSPSSASARTAIRLVMADQMDKLAGYLGLGLEPTGSSDPYGLRRAVTFLIEAAWSWNGMSSLPPCSELFYFAGRLYAKQGVTLQLDEGCLALGRLFAARYVALMPQVRHDILDSCLDQGDLKILTTPQIVRFKVELMTALAQDPGFVQTATRPLNIVAAARKKGIEVRSEITTIHANDLESEPGERLLSCLQELEDSFSRAFSNGDLDESVALLRSLQSPINDFFEGAMMMADEVKVRDARLNLLAATGNLVLIAGDFTKIVFEGSR